jgi:hypothetical protein
MLSSSFTRNHRYLIDKYHDCIKSYIKLGCNTHVGNSPLDAKLNVLKNENPKWVRTYYIIYFFVLIPIYFTFRNQTKEFLIWTILEVQFSGEPIVNKFNWWIQLPRMYLIFFLIAINFAFMNQTKEILIWVAHEVQFTK